MICERTTLLRSTRGQALVNVAHAGERFMVACEKKTNFVWYLRLSKGNDVYVNCQRHIAVSVLFGRLIDKSQSGLAATLDDV